MRRGRMLSQMNPAEMPGPGDLGGGVFHDMPDEDEDDLGIPATTEEYLENFRTQVAPFSAEDHYRFEDEQQYLREELKAESRNEQFFEEGRLW